MLCELRTPKLVLPCGFLMLGSGRKDGEISLRGRNLRMVRLENPMLFIAAGILPPTKFLNRSLRQDLHRYEDKWVKMTVFIPECQVLRFMGNESRHIRDCRLHSRDSLASKSGSSNLFREQIQVRILMKHMCVEKKMDNFFHDKKNAFQLSPLATSLQFYFYFRGHVSPSRFLDSI